MSARLSRRPFAHLAAAAALALLGATSAHAAWKWRAADGSIQYSDQPPPASVPPRDVLSRPAAAPSPAAAASRPASAPDAAAAELQRRISRDQKARDAAAAQQSAAPHTPTAAQIQACEQARQALQAIDSGVRVRVPDGHGGTMYLDDAGRAARRQQALDGIAANCR